MSLLDHDDVLEPDALFQTVKLLQQHPDADLIYSDEDKLTEDGFETPMFKPDWSPDFFLSYNYLCHFTTIRLALVRDLGGFRSTYDFAQDYDLFLRVMSLTNRIHQCRASFIIGGGARVLPPPTFVRNQTHSRRRAAA